MNFNIEGKLMMIKDYQNLLQGKQISTLIHYKFKDSSHFQMELMFLKSR